jgi:hypothetical protein
MILWQIYIAVKAHTQVSYKFLDTPIKQYKFTLIMTIFGRTNWKKCTYTEQNAACLMLSHINSQIRNIRVSVSKFCVTFCGAAAKLKAMVTVC